MKILNNNSQSKYHQYADSSVFSSLFFFKKSNFLLSLPFFAFLLNEMFLRKSIRQEKREKCTIKSSVRLDCREEGNYVFDTQHKHTPARTRTHNEINNTENPFTCRSICANFFAYNSCWTMRLRFSCFRHVWFCRFHQCQS